MSPGSLLPRVRSRYSILAGLVGVVIVVAVVMGARALLVPAFSPTGPCTVDGRQPGAYPELESLVPTSLDGKAPTSLDSGRNCTADGLGTLASHGITEVRFAGALWPTGAESGTSLAVFKAPGLTASILGEFYEAGARASSKVTSLQTSSPTVHGRPGYRLDVVNDGNLQSVVAWPDATGDVIQVAIVSGAARDGTTLALQDAAVQRAIAAFEG